MKNARLADVIQQLLDEADGIRKSLPEARDQVATLEGNLERVEEALKALGVAKKSGRGVPKKPPATREDVATAFAELLQQSKEWDSEQLKQETEKKIVEAGCSRVGFSLRFKEALPAFEKAGGQVHVSATKS